MKMDNAITVMPFLISSSIERCNVSSPAPAWIQTLPIRP